MKTNKEFLETLPQLISIKAIKNTPIEVLGIYSFSLHSALICSFNWKLSPEGHDYWNNIYEYYQSIEEVIEFDNNHHEEQEYEAEQEDNNLTQFED